MSESSPPDLLHFYIYYGSADLAFAVPSAVAREMADGFLQYADGPGRTRKAVFEANERFIEDGFRTGRHLTPEGGREIGNRGFMGCLVSAAAQARPDDRAFVMQISLSPIPLWGPDDMQVFLADQSDRPLKWYAHYQTLPGKAELDAFMAPRRARAAGAAR